MEHELPFSNKYILTLSITFHLSMGFRVPLKDTIYQLYLTHYLYFMRDNEGERA